MSSGTSQDPAAVDASSRPQSTSSSSSTQPKIKLGDPALAIPFIYTLPVPTMISGSMGVVQRVTTLYQGFGVGRLATRTDITSEIVGSHTVYEKRLGNETLETLTIRTDASNQLWLQDGNTVYRLKDMAVATSPTQSQNVSATGGTINTPYGANASTASSGPPVWIWGIIAASFVGVLLGVLVGFHLSRRSRRARQQGVIDGRRGKDDDSDRRASNAIRLDPVPPTGESPSYVKVEERRPSITKGTIEMLNELLAPTDDETLLSIPMASSSASRRPSAPPVEKMETTLSRILNGQTLRGVRPRERSNSLESSSNLPTYTEATGLPAVTLLRPSLPRKENYQEGGEGEESIEVIVPGSAPGGVGSGSPPVQASAPALE